MSNSFNSSNKAANTRPLRIVAVSGGLNNPSKTESLLSAILDQIKTHISIDVHFVKLSEIGSQIGAAIYRQDLAAHVEQHLQEIEQADVLLVATPVYRASFTGLFKHLFDFVDQFALVDKPVLLAASGGSDRHALVIEHQLRPLFSFFQANTLPIGVYATEADFSNYKVSSNTLQARIELSVQRALPFFQKTIEQVPTQLYSTASIAIAG